jgi:hypothetical protein
MDWTKAEPILRRTYALMGSTGRTTGAAVMADLGIEEDEARAAFDALHRGGYIGVEQFNANGLPFFIVPAREGLQHCSGWPAPGSSSTFLAEFLGAIEARADDAATPEEERGRLRSFVGAASGVGKDLLSDIASKVIEHQTGL